MESKESSEDDNKMHTTSKHLEDLQHKVILVQQEASQVLCASESTS
jgi:hypothetical protein